MVKLSLFKLLFSFLVIIFSSMLASCSTNLTDYQQDKLNFDIKDYFSGNVIAWGIVQDYSNKVTRRLCVEIKGTWQGNKGVLAEKFYFNDGEITYRNWQLTKQSDGSYQGAAEDVIGAAIGKNQGFAFQFQYSLLLNIDNDSYEVSMDDWMFQLDKYRVMNKTAMFKFGVNVANVTLFFDKSLPNQTCRQH
jgi:hypothetical protein